MNIIKKSKYYPEILFSATLLGIYYFISLRRTLIYYGTIDEEADYFFNGLLRADGELAHVLLHPGTLLQNIAGVFISFFPSPLETAEIIFSFMRIITIGITALAVLIFIRLAGRNIGQVGTVIALALFFCFPGQSQYLSIFGPTGFLAPMALLISSITWWTLSHHDKRFFVVPIIGLLLGILLSIKYSSILFVFVIYTVVISDRWLHKGFKAAIRSCLFLSFTIFCGYIIAIFPTYEHGYYPLLAVFWSILNGQDHLAGNHILQNFYITLKISPFGTGLSILSLLFISVVTIISLSKTQVFRPFNRIGTSKLIFILLLTCGFFISFKGQGDPSPGANVFRHVLPFSVLLPFIVLWLYELQKFAGYESVRGTNIVFLAIGLTGMICAIFEFNLWEEKKNNHLKLIHQDRKNTLNLFIKETDKVAHHQSFVDRRAEIFHIHNFQNTGARFNYLLTQMFPKESLFLRRNLHTILPVRTAQQKEHEERRLRISCKGRTNEIEVRKTLINDFVSWFGTSVLGSYCSYLVKSFSRLDYTKRHNFWYRAEVVVGENEGFTPNIITFPVDPANAPIKDMKGLNERYGISKWKDIRLDDGTTRLVWLVGPSNKQFPP